MTPSHTTPSWSTTSFGGSADTSPMELRVLGEHLSHCRDKHGFLHTLRCAAERVNEHLAGRLVTTLAVSLLLIGVGTLLL